MTISWKTIQKLYRVSPEDPGKYVIRVFLPFFDDYIDEKVTSDVKHILLGILVNVPFPRL